MFVAPNHSSRPRLGISVGKAFGNAVLRNRLKRFVRETFRLNRHRIPQNFDYLLMISPQLSKRLNDSEQAIAKLMRVTFDQVQASFLKLAEKVAQDI